MPFVLTCRQIDINTGTDARIVLLRGHDAAAFGINPGDRLLIHCGQRSLTVEADITHFSLKHGELGLFGEVWKLLRPRAGDPVTIELITRPSSISAIKNLLLGKSISRQDVFSIMTDIVNRRLSPTEITYFIASGYVRPYRLAEIVWMVEAMAKTGETFRWPHQYVVDKHSVGGLAGNRTTMVAIPIVAALGYTIPKTSSRAITSPAGTADTMEVLAPVSFSASRVRQIVNRVGGCLIWGGGLNIAPADDIIIRLSRPLSLEPYDKMLVSIMAKKVAMGVRYLIIDMPYGPGTKIPDLATARKISARFKAIARAFKIVIKIKFDPANEPIGQGIGPVLEARDVLRVLQQKITRPLDLENKAVNLAAELISLTGQHSLATARRLCWRTLRSGRAWKKMKEIIRIQGGQPDLDANDLTLGAATKRYLARTSGRITRINNRLIDEISRSLGAPEHNLAGIYLHKKIGQTVRRGEKLYTIYSYNRERLRIAGVTLENNRVDLVQISKVK